MWTEEEVKRYLPGKLCGWALDALNYLPHEFWKSNQKHRAWTLQKTLYFFDLSLSNFPTMYEDAFEKYLIEKEKYEKTVLQCEIDRPVFQSDVVDRKKLESKEVTRKLETKVEKVSADAIVKPVMTRKQANIPSTKCSSAIKAVDFGQNAMLDEKPKVGNERQRSSLRWANCLSVVETAAYSNYNGGSQNCDSNGEKEVQLPTKPKSEDEQFTETMDQSMSRWDIDKNMTGAVVGSEALEDFANRELKDDLIFSDDDFSDDNSFFDSDDENKVDCTDDDVSLPNVPERYSNSEPVKPTTKNELTIRKACCKGLIACQYITSGPCVPNFGNLIDVGETCRPHSTSAKDFVPVSAAGTLSGNSVKTELHQESSSTGSRKMDRIDVSLKSLGGKCENLKESFLTSPADDAHPQLSCKKTAAEANADGIPEASKAKKSTTPAKLGKNFFAKIWKERVVAKTDNRQHENEDSNISATVGGSGNTIQEGEIVFGASRQQLVPATLKMLENGRVDAEIAMADESVTDDVFDNATAEDLVMSNAIVDGQDESAVRSRDVASGLVQMKLEEPDYSERETWLKRENEITAGNQESGLDIREQDWSLGRECKKNNPLNSEPQLLHSSSDEILQSKQVVQSAIEQSLMVGQSKISSAEEVNFGESSNSGLECEVLHIQKGKFHDDKLLSLSKASDLDLKFPIVGETACAFDIGEDVVTVLLGSSYPKQDNEREQSSDFEVKKAKIIDRNQLSMCLSGREEIVQYRRQPACSSSTKLSRASDDHRSAELDYPELCKLLTGKQSVSRKEKWNKLKLEYQSNRVVWRKRKKRLKNETGGGHPFKHQRNKKELNKDSELRR